ncbi:phosphatase PAP2 family protein [Mucilaginibacter kameinonensis]|uniref:phosphatase PAP2 family protein n=1 Tax=Mucilaginibacter kameinonensis TaxID=452286 RepID=UPI000EF7987F|nr:phosphatase PAP2 family protein [Mucilaginibacter kameinonensis]
MGRIFYILLFSCLTFNVFAQENSSDTLRKVNIADTLKKDVLTAPDTVKHLHSKSITLIPPAVLIAYGASSFALHPLRRFDRYIYKEAGEHNFATRSHIENYLQYAPPVLVYGLNFAGIHGKNTFIDRTLVYVMAQGMLNISTFTLKKLTHRLRPDNSDYNSFPSGHTGNAFAGAEFMSQELGDNSAAYSVIGYAFATTTGVFRIYHKDHWFSDVIAGAGFGILSTKAAYLLYPYIRNNLFKAGREKEKNRSLPKEFQKKKNQGSSSILLPSLNNGTLGLHFAMSL